MAILEDSFINYSKQNGNSDLRGSSCESSPNDEVNEPLKQHDLPPNIGYEKGIGTIPTHLIVVFSGGTDRENDYLNELTKKKTFPKINLIFKSSKKGEGGLTPMQMISKFYETVEMGNPTKTHKIILSSIDRVYMVTDVDHYYNDINIILKKYKLPQTTWIISNPCFEIWLYYSYFDYICEEIKILESTPQPKQSSLLKKINHQLTGGIDPRKAFEHIREAIQNSKKNYLEDKNHIPNLFSTNMHIMGEFIYEAIGHIDFNKWLEDKRKQIEAYRKKLK